MSEEEASSPNFFMIGEKKYQNQDGYLADEFGDFILFQKEKIAIDVEPHPIISAIHAIRTDQGNRIYSIPTSPPEEKFAKVVEAMTDMHRTDGRFVKEFGMIPMEKARTNPNSFQLAHESMDLGSHKIGNKTVANKFGSQKNYEKFLHVGDDSGLMEKRKAVVKRAVARSIKGRAVEEDKKHFGALKPYTVKVKGKEVVKEPDKYIVRWQEARQAQKGSKFTNRLWKVLKWLNLDTESIVHPTDETGNLITNQAEKKEWLTNLMETDTFQSRDGKWHHFGKIDRTIPDDPKYTGLVFDRKIPTHDYQGKRISNKRPEKFGQNKNREYVEGSQGARIPLMATLKGFLDANGWSIGDNLGVSMWALKASGAKHGQIQMKAQQIVQIFQRLRDGANATGDFVNPKEYNFPLMKWYARTSKGEDIYEPIQTTQPDWKDALMYFIVGLQVGWRSEEAFSAVARKISGKDVNESGVFIKEGKEDIFLLRIHTRKTAHVGRKYQGGFILREDTGMFARKMILERLKQVENKIGIEKTLPNGDVYNDHALIGTDGKYTKIGTLQFPADARFTDLEKIRWEKAGKTIPEVKPVGRAREILHAILRNCYSDAGLNESYWHTNAGHAVRHTFAQLWMKKSGQNLAFVKEWGHWGGVDVLEKYYAEPSDDTKLFQAKQFARTDLEKLKEKEDREDAESEQRKAELAEIFETTYGDDSTTEVIKDETGKIVKNEEPSVPNDVEGDEPVDQTETDPDKMEDL